MEEIQLVHMNGFMNLELEFLLIHAYIMKPVLQNLLMDIVEKDNKILHANQKIFVELAILLMNLEENVLLLINIQMLLLLNMDQLTELKL